MRFCPRQILFGVALAEILPRSVDLANRNFQNENSRNAGGKARGQKQWYILYHVYHNISTARCSALQNYVNAVGQKRIPNCHVSRHVKTEVQIKLPKTLPPETVPSHTFCLAASCSATWASQAGRTQERLGVHWMRSQLAFHSLTRFTAMSESTSPGHLFLCQWAANAHVMHLMKFGCICIPKWTYLSWALINDSG